MKRLRRKEGYFSQLWLLATDQPHKDALPQVDGEAVMALVQQLELPEEQAEELAKDIYLIVTWHTLPELQKRVRLGRASDLAALEGAAMTARKLYDQLAPRAVDFEAFFEDFVDERNGPEEGDLARLADNVLRFAQVTDRVLGTLKDRKATRNKRRNVALALTCEAAQLASGDRIKSSRGTRKGPNWRFLNPPGRFVVGVMNLLGYRNERVLVSAFERLKWAPVTLD